VEAKIGVEGEGKDPEDNAGTFMREEWEPHVRDIPYLGAFTA
jgi:hypothetical protein